MPHPGEKRLLQIALDRCEKLPEGMEWQAEELVRAIPGGGHNIIERANGLIDSLNGLLQIEGLYQG
jgi:hypothetical protein